MKTYTTKSRFVSWLYEVIRDHITPGSLETTLRNTPELDSYTLSNNYIAEYAEDVRVRLGIPDPKFNLRAEVTDQAAWALCVPKEQVVIAVLPPAPHDPPGSFVCLISGPDASKPWPCSAPHDTEEAALLAALVELIKYCERNKV